MKPDPIDLVDTDGSDDVQFVAMNPATPKSSAEPPRAAMSRDTNNNKHPSAIPSRCFPSNPRAAFQRPIPNSSNKRKRRDAEDGIEIVYHKVGTLHSKGILSSPAARASTSYSRQPTRERCSQSISREPITIISDDEDEVSAHVVQSARTSASRTDRRHASTTTLRSPSEDAKPSIIDDPASEDEGFMDVWDDQIWTEPPSSGQHFQVNAETLPEVSGDENNPPAEPLRKHRRKNFIAPWIHDASTVDMTPLACAVQKLWSQAQVPRSAPRRSKNILCAGSARARRQLDEALSLSGLTKQVHFKHCPGSIMRIIQRNGWVIAAGACIGGTQDVENEAVNPYNEPGSLVAYCHSHEDPNKRLRVQEGHQRTRPDGTVKHYGINDIKYHPHPESTLFVSSGFDRCVKICDLSQPIGGLYTRSSVLKKFNNSPHDLAFHPEGGDEALLAVAEKTVYIFSVKSRENPAIIPAEFELPIVPSKKQKDHNVGAMRWGSGFTANHLFASSEPVDPRGRAGWHKGADIAHEKVAVEFKIDEAGDAMVVDPTGDNLIITTRGIENRNSMYLFDVRRCLGRAVTTLELVLHQGPGDAEIHDAAFSPDGVYLALGRNDGETHVYDTRFMSQGPAFRYDCGLGGGQVAPGGPDGEEPCKGVYKIQWVEPSMGWSGRQGLVTSGNDGCVRLWDPSIAETNPQNGRTLAEVDSSVATFALGSPSQREHRLIIGDSSGGVTVFDQWGDAMR